MMYPAQQVEVDRSSSCDSCFDSIGMAAPAPAWTGEAAKTSTARQQSFDNFRFADAAAAYGRAIEQDPTLLEAHFNRALAE